MIQIKRIFDLLIALLGIIVLIIPMIFIACIIFLVMGKPVFFRQKRIGYKKIPFTLFKFRTMLNGDEPDNKRLTKLGILLRKTSLDEIPQLWNIIKGDVSFVGPRPFPLKYLPYFKDEENLRFEVPPGITGLAQISGRNLLNWDERFAKDIQYVKNWNFSLDLNIMWRTFLIVLSGKGIVVDARSTMLNLDEERSYLKVK